MLAQVIRGFRFPRNETELATTSAFQNRLGTANLWFLAETGHLAGALIRACGHRVLELRPCATPQVDSKRDTRAGSVGSYLYFLRS
jgi:hypothetical protein